MQPKNPLFIPLDQTANSTPQTTNFSYKKDLFVPLAQGAKQFFSKENINRGIQQLGHDIGVPSVVGQSYKPTDRQTADMILNIGTGGGAPGKVASGLSPEAAKPVFQGLKNLTTDVMEKLKGRSTVSKQFISDLTNSPEIRQAEKNIIRQTLNSEADVVDVNKFASKIEEQLLPLTTIDSIGIGKITGKYVKPMPRYEQVSLPNELRGNVANYGERIYESPISTSAGGVHYSSLYRNKNEIKNYFAHTRIEDMADGKTRRVIENQSDLFQKGRLEGEAFNDSAASLLPPNERQRVSFLEKRLMDLEYAANKKDYSDEILQLSKERDVLMNKARKLREKAVPKRNAELSKLEPYRNTWHERIVREEVKQAAIDGKTKLQFPTGETAMKIEGLGQGGVSRWVYDNGSGGFGSYSKLTEDKLKVGMKIADDNIGAGTTGSDWIITDVLGDGKFKAVQKNFYDEVVKRNQAGEYKKGGLETLINDRAESFDISGKVDTDNPIYKFYEKEMGRFLKNKFNAKWKIDDRGVTWFEIDIPKELKNQPVKAFGKTPLFVPLAGSAAALGAVAATKPSQIKYKDNQPKTNSDEAIRPVSDIVVDPVRNLEIPKHVIEDLATSTIFGEVSNRDPELQKMEARVILNTMLNRAKEWGKSLEEVISQPMQYQAFGGKEFVKSKQSLDVPSKKKMDIINEVIQEFIEGKLKDDTNGAKFYVHAPDGRIFFSNTYPVKY